MDYYVIVCEEYSTERADYTFEVWYDEGLFHAMVREGDEVICYKWFNCRSNACEYIEAVFYELTDEEFPW